MTTNSYTPIIRLGDEEEWLREGAYYMLRDCSIIGPLQRRPAEEYLSESYPWTATLSVGRARVPWVWDRDGFSMNRIGGPCQFDILCAVDFGATPSKKIERRMRINRCGTKASDEWWPHF